MARLILIILIVTVLPTIGNSQINESAQKGRIFLNIGPEYRITPVYDPETGIVDEASYTNIDKQNSGAALNVGLEYFITNKLSVGFMNSLRYGLVVSEFTEINNDFGVKDADYKMLMGYHLYLAYYFKIIEKGEFFFNAGVSLVNRNTDHSIKKSFYNDSGQLIGTITGIEDYNFTASRLSVGYTKGKAKLFLGAYFSQQTEYFEETTSFIVPYIGLGFEIVKL